ncbi:hypothetical protein BDQ17DRAFT_1522303 [Cyathus striatus]|nr:hypothetical protein BDQ17DRAFT_1522303 [Cyathus striatus]
MNKCTICFMTWLVSVTFPALKGFTESVLLELCSQCTSIPNHPALSYYTCTLDSVTLFPQCIRIISRRNMKGRQSLI